MAHSIKNLLTDARRKLSGNPSANLDAEVLLAHVLETSRTFLYANPDLELPAQRSEAFKRLVKKRLHGQPIAYLTGKCEFWSLPLTITPSVLIPRPETELLVEAALDRIPPGSGWRVADLGTGSGAIALALASERICCEIHGTDISKEALKVAAANANALGLTNLRFHCGSWAEPLDGQFDLVASNPPYVDDADPHLQQGDLRFEPREALSPGGDGLSAIREIADQSYALLKAAGWLILEHGWQQGEAVRQVLRDTAYA
ncbi:MAG: peptide chain release factor N(5)-glutamine methyltransferase, partial [Lysobacterales bacterium]